MRAVDQLECRALGHSPKAALRHSLRSSLWTLTALLDDEPVAMIGVAPQSMVEGIGIPFFLGTDAIYSHPRTMLTKGRDVIAHMRSTFPRLENIVSTGNAAAIRLLARWGFTVGGDVKQIGGVPFIPFSMGRADV